MNKNTEKALIMNILYKRIRCLIHLCRMQMHVFITNHKVARACLPHMVLNKCIFRFYLNSFLRDLMSVHFRDKVCSA